MEDKINYLELSNQKIMYLVNLMRGKGYPVTQIYEKDVKPIDTMRFDAFLAEQDYRQRREEELNAINEFSFYTEDSYMPLVEGFQIKPIKPEEIPMLDFDRLPDYVSSSDGEADYEQNEVSSV